MSYRIVLAEISYQWYWFSFREYNPNITEVGESLYLAVIRDAYAPDLAQASSTQIRSIAAFLAPLGSHLPRKKYCIGKYL